jgi:hypothetical protein
MSRSVTRFLKELRRRRVFRVAGIYVVGVWLLMQAADVLFPGWGIHEAAIRYLFWAGIAGIPVALVFGWVFDISAQGIRRTRPATAEAELRQALPLGLGDHPRAIDLLERAADAGWRAYFPIRRDPRWDPARADPKFQAVLDRQRAELEAIEAEDDFEARLDAALKTAQGSVR